MGSQSGWLYQGSWVRSGRMAPARLSRLARDQRPQRLLLTAGQACGSASCWRPTAATRKNASGVPHRVWRSGRRAASAASPNGSSTSITAPASPDPSFGRHRIKPWPARRHRRPRARAQPGPSDVGMPEMPADPRRQGPAASARLLPSSCSSASIQLPPQIRPALAAATGCGPLSQGFEQQHGAGHQAGDGPSARALAVSPRNGELQQRR